MKVGRWGRSSHEERGLKCDLAAVTAEDDVAPRMRSVD